jgi:hypothetical protein
MAAALNTSNTLKVSLVTSFWAEEVSSSSTSATTRNPHRKEMEAALLANLYNEHFDQVIVFLDGVTNESNCVHFVQNIVELQHAHAQIMHHHDDDLISSKLTCVNVKGSQPTYYQMFMNAISNEVMGDVVVMANADQAFDNTISLARDLNPEVLSVVGTRGFSPSIPSPVKAFYDTIVGTEYITQKEKTRGEWDRNLCYTKYSFDTWIFHKSKMTNLNPVDFQRPDRNDEYKFFYMNEMGAENAALYGVQQSYPWLSLFNSCERIHTWHFHLTPKTHHAQKTAWKQPTQNRQSPEYTPAGSVTKPWGGYAIGRRHVHPLLEPPECFHADPPNSCFLHQGSEVKEV